MNDRIFVTGIEVFARHGVMEHEAVEGQTFVVDLELELDLSRPGYSDDLEDTADYGDLTRRVHDLVANERWRLVEKLAQRIADTVLVDERVGAVTVVVHKPQAPIEVPFGDVGVRIRRSR